MHDVKLLPSAQADMETGFWFYEAQADRLGEYFLDCLIADIESLCMFAGIHPKSHGGFFEHFQSGFPLPSTTKSSTRLPSSRPFWTAVKTLRPSVPACWAIEHG